MRFGYKLIPNNGDTMVHLVKDHCSVLSATLNMVLWNLCRQDILKDFFHHGEIFNAETNEHLCMIDPDKTIIDLEIKRDTNRVEWETVSNQLSRDDWKNKTPLYKKLLSSLDKHKTIDEKIVNDTAARVSEIETRLKRLYIHLR